MKGKNILRSAIALLFIGIILLISACDEWIIITVRVVNEHATDPIQVYIQYGDDKDTTNQYTIDANPPAPYYHDFNISFYDKDKYGEIRIIARNTNTSLRYESIGNVAENDWIIYVRFPSNFHQIF